MKVRSTTIVLLYWKASCLLNIEVSFEVVVGLLRSVFDEFPNVHRWLLFLLLPLPLLLLMVRIRMLLLLILLVVCLSKYGDLTATYRVYDAATTAAVANLTLLHNH